MKKVKIVKVAIQMDKLSKINRDTDSTLALIKEAIKKKFSVFIYTVDNMYYDRNKLKAVANQVIKVDTKKEKFLELEKPKIISLNTFEFILIRQDPPFNMQYLTATYLLERLPKIV